MGTLRILLLLSELLAFVLSIIALRTYRNELNGGQFIAIFLGIVFLSEFFSWLCLYKYVNLQNTVIVNFQLPFQILFYAALFYHNLESKKRKIFVLIASILYVIVFSFENTVLQDIQGKLNFDSYLIGAFLVIVSSLLYLVEFVTSTRDSHILGNVLNWWSIGLFIAFVVDMVVFSLSHFYYQLSPEFKDSLYYINHIRVFFMILLYLLIALGFLYSKWKKQIS